MAIAEPRQPPLGYRLVYVRTMCKITKVGLSPPLQWPPPSLGWLHKSHQAYPEAWEPPWPLQSQDSKPLATDLCISVPSFISSYMACHLLSDGLPQTYGGSINSIKPISKLGRPHGHCKAKTASPWLQTCVFLHQVLHHCKYVWIPSSRTSPKLVMALNVPK